MPTHTPAGPRPHLPSVVALAMLQSGHRMARHGWNGTGMYVVVQSGYPEGIGINARTAHATGLPEGTVRRFEPYFMLRTATGSFSPWTGSNTDWLTDDWYPVPPESAEIPVG